MRNRRPSEEDSSVPSCLLLLLLLRKVVGWRGRLRRMREAFRLGAMPEALMGLGEEKSQNGI
jgi:hypothetical protein